MQAITRDQLKNMNQKHEDFVLINVLPQASFNEAHIRTSVNVPVEENDFADRVLAISGSKDRKVIVYCADFDCDASSRAANKLKEAGFKKIFDYEGGTRDWMEHNRSAA